MGGRTNIPKIDRVEINTKDEAKRVNKIRDILSTVMAEHAIAKAKGKI